MKADEKRRYDSTRRAARAALTRARIIEAAADLFATNGYAGTAMTDIADTAHVSVDTVYANGSKAELIVAAIELATFGREGTIPIFEHDIGARITAAASPDDVADAWADFVERRIAAMTPLWLAFDAAADTDAAIDARRAEWYAGMTEALGELVDFCASKDWLGGSLTREQRIAALIAFASGDSYRRIRTAVGLDARAIHDLARRTLDWVLFGRA